MVSPLVGRELTAGLNHAPNDIADGRVNLLTIETQCLKAEILLTVVGLAGLGASDKHADTLSEEIRQVNRI